jgi:2,3-diphosphopglycerate-independent phosphoglycerate mutase
MPDKYCVLILDGAAGWPIKEKGNKTSLELARTPNLDALTREGFLGLTNNVPSGMEPSSAIACMSLLGYDPEVYYRGRAAIEAVSLGVPIGQDEVIFRCNLVAVKGGRMWSYCAGHITDAEASELMAALNEKMGSETVRFYPGVSYRHLLKLRGHAETVQASCTPGGGWSVPAADHDRSQSSAERPPGKSAPYRPRRDSGHHDLAFLGQWTNTGYPVLPGNLRLESGYHLGRGPAAWLGTDDGHDRPGYPRRHR